LIFDYGQRHKREINAAKKIASNAGVEYRIVKIELPWKGSLLLDNRAKITESLSTKGKPIIPGTYVPARNIIFLSFAISYAETIHAKAVFIGAHQEDYSGYPDCRKEFFRAFRPVIATGTKTGAQKEKIKVITPLLDKTKAEIIQLGARLGVNFALTWSCYRGEKFPCGNCDSCFFRAKGFAQAGLMDPLIK
jgi:7-cyano-7-deazaguanine synthase